MRVNWQTIKDDGGNDVMQMVITEGAIAAALHLTPEGVADISKHFAKAARDFKKGKRNG